MDFCFNSIYVKRKMLLPGGHFSLPDKGLYVIQGRNGTGKSLLLNALFQQQTAAGTRCVFIDQSNNRLLPGSSVIENIAFSCEKKQQQAAENKLEEQGFRYLTAHTVREMSGGEKRMTCILRGLQAENVQIFFIDEPTNDLDIRVVSSFLEMLAERAKNALILAISHDDRISGMADGIFRIADEKLSSEDVPIVSDPGTHYDFEETQQSRSDRGDCRALLAKQFSVKLISVFLCILFAIVTVYSGHSIVRSANHSLPPMRGDQIDIFIPVSEYGAEIKKASLPIAYVPFLNGETKIAEFTEARKADKSDSRNVNFTLDLPDSEMYTVYNLEYYDVFSHRSFFTAEKYFELTGETALNTNGLFDFSFSIHNSEDPALAVRKNELDAASEYYQTNSASNGKPYEPVFCTVVLHEGYTLSDFLQSDELRPMLDGNFYIRSNDTITMLNDAELFQAQKGTLLSMLICSLLVLLMEMIFSEIYMYLGRINIRVFRNMAYEPAAISKSIFRASKDRLIRTVSVLCMAAVCLGAAGYYTVQGLRISFLYWGYYLYYILIVLLTGAVVKTICRKKTLRYTDWRFR